VIGLTSRGLVVLAVMAVLVESTGTVGWWSWKHAVNLLREDSGAGAEALVDDPLLRLPSVARRTRRLPVSLLAEAPEEIMVSALLTVADDQIRWTPTDPHGFVNQARAELIVGEMELASEALDGAIVRDPTSPELHLLAALAARAGGRNTEALDHLANASGLGSSGWKRRIDLTPEETDRVVIEGLRRKIDYYPRARTSGVLSLARELRRRDQEGMGRRALEAEPASPRIVLELARWDVGAGSFVEAQERLKALTEHRGLPASILAEAWAVTATARDGSGDPEGAMAAADAALRYDPRSAAPYRVLATLAERRGDMAAALEHLRRAWGMNPTDVGLLMAVARTAEKAGRHDDARLALDRAVTVEPENPSTRASLVEYLLRRGDFMEATLALSDALKRFPTDPRLLRLADRLRGEVSRR
jgi:tetratricopeptide (TPR) repeat protein